MADSYTFIVSGSPSLVFNHSSSQNGAYAEYLNNIRGVWNGSDQKYYTPTTSSLNYSSHGSYIPPSNVVFHALHYGLIGQYASGADINNRVSDAGDTVSGANLRVWFFSPRYYPTLERSSTGRLTGTAHGFSGTWKMICDRLDGGGSTSRSTALWLRIS